jgi:hypothetical protein
MVHRQSCPRRGGLTRWKDHRGTALSACRQGGGACLVPRIGSSSTKRRCYGSAEPVHHVARVPIDTATTRRRRLRTRPGRSSGTAHGHERCHRPHRSSRPAQRRRRWPERPSRCGTGPVAASAMTAGAAGGPTTTSRSPPPSSDTHSSHHTHAAGLHPWGLACCAVERAGVCAARSGAQHRRVRAHRGAPARR